MSPHYHFLYLLILLICMIIIYSDYKKLKHYESIEEYYGWKDCVESPPPHSGKYLLQYGIKENDEKQIIIIQVIYYNARKKEWLTIPDNCSNIAWCHLPNYLYPDTPNRV